MADKENKLGFGGKLAKWFRETRSELKKVVWPTPKQVLNNSIVVVIAVLTVGVFIFAFDFLAGSGVQWLLRTFKG